MVNLTNFTALSLNPAEPMGLVALVIGVVLVVAAFYVFFRIIKDLIANAIIGGIGLIVIHFVAPFAGINVEITLLNILIALIAGLPGLIIILLLSVFGPAIGV